MKYLEDEKLTQWTGELTDAVLAGRVINGRIEAFTMKRAGTDKKYAHALGERYVAEMELAENQLADYQQFLQKRGTVDTTTRGSSSPKRKRSVSAGNEGEATVFKSNLRALSVDTGIMQSISEKPTKIQRARATSFDSTAPHQNTPSPFGDFQEIGTRRLMTDLILTLNASFPDYDFGNVRPSHFIKTTAKHAMNDCNARLSELASRRGESFLREMWNAIDNVICLAETEVFSYEPPAIDDDPFGFLTETLLDDGADDATPLWSFNHFFVNKNLKRILVFSCVETMRTMEVSDEEDAQYAVRYKTNEMDFDLDPSSDVAGGIPIDF
jgi:hypothetical protein